MPDILIEELARAKARVVQIEQAIARANAQKLADLPAQYGFESVRDFVAAVKAAGTKRKTKIVKTPGTRGKRRQRAVIDDAVRSKVAKLVKAGKSGTEISKEVGISLPSVQNVKKSLGLVKSRSAKSAKPKVAKAKKTEPAAG